MLFFWLAIHGQSHMTHNSHVYLINIEWYWVLEGYPNRVKKRGMVDGCEYILSSNLRANVFGMDSVIDAQKVSKYRTWTTVQILLTYKFTNDHFFLGITTSTVFDDISAALEAKTCHWLMMDLLHVVSKRYRHVHGSKHSLETIATCFIPWGTTTSLRITRKCNVRDRCTVPNMLSLEYDKTKPSIARVSTRCRHVETALFLYINHWCTLWYEYVQRLWL